ncbi:MAG: epimerase, partial [Daejeonella sp.]
IEVPITISGNYRLGDIRHNYADLSKIEKILGYKAKFSFDKGINEVTEWVNCQKVEEDNYLKSIEEMKIRGLYK